MVGASVINNHYTFNFLDRLPFDIVCAHESIVCNSFFPILRNNLNRSVHACMTLNQILVCLSSNPCFFVSVLAIHQVVHIGPQ